MEIKIAPSLLASDFLHLEKEIRRAEEAGADWLHCDVMDGVYVPNISFGFAVLEPISKMTRLPLDVHMMTTCPDRYIDKLASIGTASVTVHSNAMDPERTAAALRSVREAGMKAAVALSPKRPAEELAPFLPLIDMALVMTVEPGFGGQKFMADMIPKVTAVRKMLDLINPAAYVQVDGGIGRDTIKAAAGAGADAFVIGTASFRADDMKAAVTEFRSSAETAYRTECGREPSV